jgi:hypothetical protein
LLYRVEAMEKDISGLKGQLSLYEPMRENDYKLQRINDTVGRIESELHAVKDRLEAVNTHMITSDTETQRRDTELRLKAGNLYNKILISVLAFLFSGILSVLVFYVTRR